MKIAEIFGIDDGPLFEEIRRNILHLNGPDHRRLRGLVNPFFTPRAVERWRPDMRGFLEQLHDEPRRGDRLRGRRGLLQALPVADDRDGDGRAARRAGLLYEWSPGSSASSAERRGQREQIDGRSWSSTPTPAAARPRRAAPGDDLIAPLIPAEQERERLNDSRSKTSS